eukprot:jgi/Chlat1/4442/Chrsp29S04397
MGQLSAAVGAGIVAGAWLEGLAKKPRGVRELGRLPRRMERAVRWLQKSSRRMRRQSMDYNVDQDKQQDKQRRQSSRHSMELLVHMAGQDTPSCSLLNEQQVEACQQAVELLSSHIATLSASRRGFDQEFDQLCQFSESRDTYLRAGGTAEAVRPINKDKNRYNNVLPFDRTLVRLRHKQVGEDYINASYLQDRSVKGLPMYIATQGPLDSTTGDFWEMVWQERCAAIVMLTRLVEGARVKSGSYFPEERGDNQIHGRYAVENMSSFELFPYIVQRGLRITQQTSGKVRQLLHFQYTEWPDHGVPESSRSLCKLAHHLRQMGKPEGPFVIHCSAGIGRTGTFVVIDDAIRRILKLDPTGVHLQDTLSIFRRQRAGLVQTKEQYKFCYMTILEELQCLIKAYEKTQNFHQPPAGSVEHGRS